LSLFIYPLQKWYTLTKMVVKSKLYKGKISAQPVTQPKKRKKKPVETTVSSPSGTTKNAPSLQAKTGKKLDFAQLATLVACADTPHEMTTVHAPFTGEVLGSVPIATTEDVQAAIQRARTAQRSWSQTRMAERKSIFMRYHDLILKHQEELLDLLQIETGKSRLTAIDEVFDVLINSRHYAVRAAKYLRPQRRKGALPILTQTKEYHHPVGVVGIIAPWNYPLALAISDAIPAIIAGNSVVLKPAEETPFIALLGAQLLYEAGVPRDVFQVVTGKGRVMGPTFVKEADYLCFTGGTSTGRLLASQAGERLIKCSMELGGKNPAIVLDDADLEKTTVGVMRGIFANTGQLCVHTERIYVQSGIYDRFVNELVKRVKEMKVSSALDFSADMGSLISKGQLDKVTQHVEDALKKGATLLTGGKARPDLGQFFFEPTLFTNVTPEMELFAEETFGPVAAIYKFDKVEDAIQMANASSYGLNSNVWTRDIQKGQWIASQIQSGTSNVNESLSAAWGSVDSPMGGMKTSGLGRRHGAEGILKYTESQTVATQHLMLIGPSRLLPRERYASVMSAVLKLMKMIPGLR
jgi:succinate-semialdehyde dehydrogenase / glutarate-semialdehyde dehydrogenase